MALEQPVQDFGPAIDATRDFNRQVRDWLKHEVREALAPIVNDVRAATRMMFAAAEDAKVTRSKMEEIAKNNATIAANYSRLNGQLTVRDLERDSLERKFDQLHTDVKRYIDIVTPRLPIPTPPDHEQA